MSSFPPGLECSPPGVGVGALREGDRRDSARRTVDTVTGRSQNNASSAWKENRPPCQRP